MRHHQIALFAAAAIFALVVSAIDHTASAQILQRVSFSQPKSASIGGGFIGVGIVPISPEIADALGVEAGVGELVIQVAPDGPAERGGILSGDVITTVGGISVSSNHPLSALLANFAPETSVTLGFIRNGQRLTKVIKLTSRPSDGSFAGGSAAMTSNNSGTSTMADPASGRALGENMLQCERIEMSGNAEHRYAAYLDVENGRTVALPAFNYQDEAGRFKYVPSGQTSATSSLKPKSRSLAPGVIELSYGYGHKGMSAGQTFYKFVNGNPNQKNVFRTSLAVDLQIPGTTTQSNDSNELGMRIFKNGKPVWQLTNTASISSFYAPKITMNPNFENGEELDWLNGLITAEIRFGGQTVATYELDLSQMDAKGMRSRGDGAFLDAPYKSGTIPIGCKLEPIP